MSGIPLLLFAKAPIAGQVKTRLHSHCSPEQAAVIAEILLEESIVKAQSAWPGEVHLSVWLDYQHEFLQRMQKRYSLKVAQQAAGDLGEKMLAALNGFGYPAVVMGCDAPHVPAQVLQNAFDILSSGQSVIGPSEDGGYYLLGLQQPQPNLFNDIAWGGDQVLETTLVRARSTGLALHQLDVLNDVDEWQDVCRAARVLPRLADYIVSQGLVS